MTQHMGSRNCISTGSTSTGIQPVALEALPWVDEIVREAVALAREQRGG
jgi:hypothetical protein